MCGELRRELLVSNELLSEFVALKKYEIAPVGAIHLRGKEREIELSSLELKT